MPAIIVCRVVICGGGIMGAATAYYLAQLGVAATVVERESVAAAASGTHSAAHQCPSQACGSTQLVRGQLLVDAASGMQSFHLTSMVVQQRGASNRTSRRDSTLPGLQLRGMHTAHCSSAGHWSTASLQVAATWIIFCAVYFTRNR
jgi:2-polyprenyl-6-methoxyphenol hydroxylase-like FAD-dependent oxidoreductase